MSKMLKIIFCLIIFQLTGCATTITSQVTAFQQWPSDLKDKTYVLQATPEQENSPEIKHYGLLLRNEFLKSGFIEVNDAQLATLTVSMAYQTIPGDVNVSMPYAPMMGFSYWPMSYSRRHFGLYYSPTLYYGSAMNMGMGMNMRVNRYFQHQFKLTISNDKTKQQYAEMKVMSDQLNSEIAVYMPYLIEGALTNFPRKNGSISNVVLPLTKQ